MADESGDVLWVESEWRGDALIVRAVGELDASTLPSLRQALAACGTPPVALRTLALDLSGVTFFGAAGLATVLETNQCCRQAGIRLAVVTSQAVSLMLQLSGTDELVTTAASVWEACRA
jgi:anti-anti-sigma factor